MNKLTCVVASLFALTGANAEISANQFLRQAIVATASSRLPAAPDRPGGLNRWFNEAQVRLADDPDTRSYALRVSPKMPNQISAEKAILGLREQQRELSRETDLNDRLMVHYEQWLDLVEQQNRVAELEQARTLADAEVQYQRSLAQTDDFRPTTLLEAELSLAGYVEQDRMQRERLAATRAALDIEPLPRGLVGIEEMLRVVAATPAAEASIDQRVESLALELARERVRLDRAQQGWALDLMQVEVANDTRSNRDSRGFLVGVRVPLGGASFNTAQREYDVIAATSDLERRTFAAQLGATNRRELLDWRRSEADAIRDTLAAIDERLERARQSGDIGVLVTVQWEQVKARERLMEVRQLAVRHYLEYLHLTGRLAQQPLRNWLSPGLEPL
jgi:hypothetical protein